ncbi:MAG: hypothetical protein LBQ63_06055 [Deltaproteobacteria bacterium]|jgi:hypothetical protein|nr:hypothetical protein [Deltaproteobacteria bacterium]
MKYTLLLLSIVLLVCSSCIPGQEYSAEDPRGYADRYYFTQSEKVCYLEPDDVVIYMADGVDTGLKKGRRPMAIPPDGSKSSQNGSAARAGGEAAL